MTKTSHTPAPWHNQSGKIVYRFDSGPSETIATVQGTFGEPNPNARLIAAAPSQHEAHVQIDDLIHKHMGAIEAGEYSPAVIAEILAEIQSLSN